MEPILAEETEWRVGIQRLLRHPVPEQDARYPPGYAPIQSTCSLVVRHADSADRVARSERLTVKFTYRPWPLGSS